MTNYKLVERYEAGRVHLYDLSRDLGETNDLAAAEAGRVQSMRRELHQWYRDLDAQFLQAKSQECTQPWRPGAVNEAPGPLGRRFGLREPTVTQTFAPRSYAWFWAISAPRCF